MQVDSKQSVFRAVGLMAMLAVGLVLGAAVPVLAGAEVTTDAIVCSTDEIVPVESSEWAAPPVQETRGEPY